MNLQKFLIIGSGAIAQKHIKTLRAITGPSVSITAVSRSQQNLNSLLQKVGPPLLTQTDRQFQPEFFRDHAAIIASPPGTHLNWIKLLAPHLNTIMVEKPAVTGSDEIASVDEILARHPQLRLMVAENYDFKPSLISLIKIRDSSQWGTLKKIHLRKELLQKAEDWKANCSTLFEGGIHFVALANSLAGSDPIAKSVEILDWRLNKSAVERGSKLRWTCANGVEVNLAYGWDRFSPSFGIGQFSKLEFERGQIEFESNGLWIQGQGMNFNDVSGSSAMIEEFVRVAAEKNLRSFQSSWSKAKKDLELVFEAYLRAGSRPLLSALAKSTERHISNPA